MNPLLGLFLSLKRTEVCFASAQAACALAAHGLTQICNAATPQPRRDVTAFTKSGERRWCWANKHNVVNRSEAVTVTELHTAASILGLFTDAGLSARVCVCPK